MEEEYFDFEEKIEEAEETNTTEFKTCPNCKNPVPSEAIMCLYCGEAIRLHEKPKWIIWVAVFLIIAFLALILIH